MAPCWCGLISSVCKRIQRSFYYYGWFSRRPDDVKVHKSREVLGMGPRWRTEGRKLWHIKKPLCWGRGLWPPVPLSCCCASSPLLVPHIVRGIQHARLAKWCILIVWKGCLGFTVTLLGSFSLLGLGVWGKEGSCKVRNFWCGYTCIPMTSLSLGSI